MIRNYFRSAWAVLAFGCLGLTAAMAQAPQARAELNLIRVTITSRGIQLSQSVAKPGRVRFLVDNQILLTNPAIELVASTGNGPAAARMSAGAPARRALQEATLTPGTYRLRLVAEPRLQTEITVKP